MNKGPKERFSEVAADYARYRPSYPSEAVAWLVETLGGRRWLDLGCGTGIFSRMLAERGLEVTGVDPNEEMLALARAAGGGPRYVRGEAASTGMPDAAFDSACAAQAFHWFELGRTLAELRRALVPGGRCAAVWNLRASSPLLDEYEALLRRRSSEYGALGRPRDTIDALKRSLGRRAEEIRTFSLIQRLDRESILGRARSSSYVAHGVADLPAFERELEALFDRHQSGGAVEWRYDTVVLVFAP